ncbi:RNA polymerase sigma factor [Novipirellula galeiformis]|uniref:RNA polymerase sigma factor n=1 Tax=Novipirellula galeiformis TaxID=2528004 RepID=A0A5C6CFL8_9BACT|nr:sigma-70 family RNA polymerase sigma factor [Novipirellula galeiformis]TWU23420.1 RNA polymerase sigma factor [Novipirellula galeiformis]
MEHTNRSLLELARGGNDAAWSQLVDIYQPLIASWLRRYSIPAQDAADVAQEIMTIMIKELPRFEHSGRTGAFRSWLRSVTANRVRQFWRDGRLRPIATGDDDFRMMLSELEDPNSEMTRRWNEQHDVHVLQHITLAIEGEFTEKSMQVFRRHVLQQRDASEVAKEAGISSAGVYQIKSRILRRLRQEAEGLLQTADDGEV